MPDSNRITLVSAFAAFISASAVFAALPGRVVAAEREVRLVDGRASFSSGSLRLEIAGAEVWSHAVKGVPADAEPEVSAHTLSSGETAIDVLFRDKSGVGVFEVVAVRDKDARALRMVWNGSIAPKGDPGERARLAIRFEDLTSDGAPEIVLGTAYEPVRICGRAETPLLFRSAYDAKARKFRDILARRPGITPSADLVGAVGAEGEPPLIAVTSAESASRVMGDSRDTLLLSPPSALVDGDPSTVWIPGAGASLGEFATLGAFAEQYGIVRIGVARPANSKKTAWRRPLSVLLVTSKETFRLSFPAGGNGAADMVWFDLKAPLRTSCLSFVVEGVEEGDARGQLALGEIVVLTELDREGGLERLARDLAAAASGEKAASLLKRAGEKALAPIRAAWPKLGEAGRRRAVRVIADVAAENGVDLLAEAAVGKDEIAAGEAVFALARVPAKAAAALSQYLSSADERRFEGAAAALASMRSEVAMDALCGAVGKGGRARRQLVRKEIARLAREGKELEDRLASSLASAASGADSERTMDLLRASSAVGRVPEAALALALAAAAPGKKFEDRYRALEVVSASRDAAAITSLLEAVTDGDAKIRNVAARGLSAFARESFPAANALLAAAADADVQVRLTALAGLRGNEAVKGAAQKLASVAADDAWPVVRAAAVELAPQLPSDVALGMLARASRDRSYDVRIRALGVAPLIPGPEIDAIVLARLSDEAEPPFVRTAAASAARARCQSSAAEPLFALLRKGAEPLAERRDVDAAIVAAGALGAIGGERSVELLKKARQRSNPATDAAIDAALKNPGEECGGSAHPAKAP